MEDLMVIINLLAIFYMSWYVDWALKQNKSKAWLFSGLVLIMLAVLITLPYYGPTYSYIMLTGILVYLILTVSWSMFSGPTGYYSLAPAAFFGVGIYTAAIISKSFPELPALAQVIFGGLFSFVLAAFVGAITLRLRGIYFIVFTFGLVLLIISVLLWYEIKFTGTRGRFILNPADNETIFYIMLGITVLLFLAAYLVRRSKYGLALQSIGQNEEAAAHMGINVNAVKITIFSISAIFMGMAGAIMANKYTYVDPYSAFDVFRSFLPVLMAIFGGMKRFYGPVLGAVILAFLEEKLLTEFPYFYKLSFGVVLILVIMYLPDGLVGLVERVTGRFKGVKRAGA